ncbi:microfibrillar-associated protein 2 [Trichomycterus rosablanca]|uniref:microfibrillar-associated protein 2 n=1 Tax=Trichomycterus rosablanca TaxID=2290929 RepID=UPI002F352390
MRTGILLLLGLPVLLAQTFDNDYREGFDTYKFDPDESYDHIPEIAQQLSQHSTGQQTVLDLETEPTEPGPVDCREEQYPCTRLYSVHQPCKQCLNSICFYSLRRTYVINREICVRTVCAHEELLKADLCRDQYPRCGVAALTGQCGSMGGSCGRSCGGC